MIPLAISAPAIIICGDKKTIDVKNNAPWVILAVDGGDNISKRQPAITLRILTIGIANFVMPTVCGASCPPVFVSTAKTTLLW